MNLGGKFLGEIRQYAHFDDEDLEIQRKKAEFDVKRAENKLAKIVEEQERRDKQCFGERKNETISKK